MNATFSQLHDIDGVPATATEAGYTFMNRTASFFDETLFIAAALRDRASRLHFTCGTTEIDTADLWRLKQAINHRDEELDAREWNETYNSQLP